MQKIMHTAAWLLCIVLSNTYNTEGALAFRLCGQKLVNIMKNLCNHKYLSPQAVYSPGYYSNQRQPRSGIVESCCWRQCTYAYLRSYCDQATDITSTTRPVTSAHWLLHPNKDQAQAGAESISSSRQQYLIRPGTSNVWHDESGSTAPASTRRHTKTFRSLFHLLSYLSQFLSPTSAQPTTTQTTFPPD